MISLAAARTAAARAVALAAARAAASASDWSLASSSAVGGFLRGTRLMMMILSPSMRSVSFGGRRFSNRLTAAGWGGVYGVVYGCVCGTGLGGVAGLGMAEAEAEGRMGFGAAAAIDVLGFSVGLGTLRADLDLAGCAGGGEFFGRGMRGGPSRDCLSTLRRTTPWAGSGLRTAAMLLRGGVTRRSTTPMRDSRPVLEFGVGGGVGGGCCGNRGCGSGRGAGPASSEASELALEADDADGDSVAERSRRCDASLPAGR